MSDQQKSTHAEIEQRVNDVYDALLLGLSRREIIQYASVTKKWNVTPRQIDTYILSATEQLKKAGQRHRETEMGKALARLEKLYQSNLKIQDYKAALAVQQEITKLQGMYPATKVEATGANGGAILVEILRGVSMDDL